MLTYTYTARDSKSGQKISADIQANNEAAAAKILIDRGLSPLDIKLKEEGGSLLGGFRHHVPTKQKILFSRQLSTLINAGLPLVQSLNNVKDQTHDKNLKLVLEQVIIDVEAGSSFSDTLAKYPRIFNEVFVSLIAAGEASGTLDQSLERLANQQEKDADIIAKVRGAMVYPIIVLLVMGGVVVFLLVTVLPQVEILYKGFPGAKLPLVTVGLLDVAHFIIKFWWLVIILLIGAGLFSLRWSRTIAGKSAIDRIKLKAWPVGPLFRKLYMARFARTGSTLVASGVPMIKMLQTTADAVNNVHIAHAINRAAEAVKGGKSLSESLEKEPDFLDLVPDMIKVGEQSGSLETMLGKVADYYEKEVDNQIKTISSLIEPVLMIVVGILALLIVAAVLLPVYSLAGKSFLGSGGVGGTAPK
jgi:type IV pilus assembly protein PilC